MNRRNFIGALFLAPLLVKEALAVQKKNRLFAVGDYQPFKPHRRLGLGLGLYEKLDPSYLEYEVSMTRMNWKMNVTDLGVNSYEMFGLSLPEFYNDQFRRSRRKNGLIKLGKAIR